MVSADFLIERIQWHEGMLLSPQHFQHESARTDALIAWHTLAANPYAWGVRALKVDEGLLATGLLRIQSLEAVMPDGTAVSHFADESGGPDLQLDLSEFGEELERGALDVYLTLGRARSMRDPARPSRFKGVASLPVEDEVSDALPVDLPRMRPNLALSAGSVPSSVFLHLRLMTVQKDNEVYKLGKFVPALLCVPPNSLILQRASALATQIRSKAAFLAKQTAGSSSKIEERLSMLELRERLGSLSLMLPFLEAVLRAPVLPPFSLYLALCAQLGSMAMLRPGAVPLVPPAWNHADPWSVFEPLFESLEASVSEVSQDWRAQIFSFDGGVFALGLKPEWMSKRLVVGLRGQPERDLSAWMAGAIVGSQTVWTALSDKRVLGAARRKVDEVPELGLRSSGGYCLFSIEVSADFIVADQPLIISNANEVSAAQRPLELVLFTKG